MQCDWHYIANFAMFMAYQLAIDSGNTSVKVYLAADGEIVGCHPFACLADAETTANAHKNRIVSLLNILIYCTLIF